ncbi:GNAT family N-acetyltransferase [Crocosphaera sp. XPORK-15E]|uniref:GNAT family N-acetyltransferase n=1 Tax=Crocosphaera sp. XPORK-15E TaxID=3110247 RepID=UPI002B201DF4|nr:GNAT family N-acetyltransferase [Crocosphaera sp. XPORK-15E]MEA5533346.1 GNAT family N-acetyltransferase [Crocosphaera sp. XPORK-15E]
MTASFDNHPKPLIRPVQYRDLDWLEALASESAQAQQNSVAVLFQEQLQQVRPWFGLLKFLSWFPNIFQDHFRVYVAELPKSSQESSLRGFIQISPFNTGRSTWRVERVIVADGEGEPELLTNPKGIGSQLLRHCLETIWEARTWVLEVNINDKNTLALYRQSGFQPLAQLTYWFLEPELLQQLSQNNLDLPNLLPVSNADAHLLYQLDCVSMPPLLRQVFDRNPQDFRTRFLRGFCSKWQQWFHQKEMAEGYVFEPQRKAAIGYFKLTLSKDGSQPHQAQLTVHPAYTWLYPQLLAQMGRIVQKFPNPSLELVSSDYQHEREEYLEKLGAKPIEHTLLMSRSVWHKLKEAKPEGLHLSEMLQGLQAVPRTPIPSRMAWLKTPLNPSEKTTKLNNTKEQNSSLEPSENTDQE